ncbi:glycosyltransferase involved in cell wall biosynthesis [Chitinophaga polysaccharea]|uniref:Glycosyltransferase involved in cell wall biosynthesis n=1 Tax=Chitinophaga polysaccharea TaxID=1293035 RepID=A0A561PR47_9BACT|nr:glycosyltransferase [Chitinophaga polysaccharea]TWF40551.1 glycosyltransferase involved in cell wall biosynthesis [Chitinophaga polysaccharea]
MPNPVVSIIVPVYNVAPYLLRCMESLRHQTYTSTELIFVNDGSTDNSLAILQSLQQQYPAIKILSQENAGPGPARNNGLDHANGDYVLFVDGDDWIDPQTVARCINEAQTHAADIVCFGFRKVYQQGDSLMEAEPWTYEPESFINSDYIISFFSEAMHRKDKLNTAAWGKLYRRALIEEHSIRFRQSTFEDSPFVLEAVYASRNIRFLTDTFYAYFVREKQVLQHSITSQQVNAAKISSFYSADLLMKAFLHSKNIFEKYRRYYYAYHNTRILQYGGYMEIYAAGNGQQQEAWPIFFAQLKEHRHDLTLDRKGLYRAYRKRIVALNIGAMVSGISPRLAHRFFRWYEKTMAPK